MFIRKLMHRPWLKRANQLLEEAHEQFSRGDREATIALCREAAELQPDRPVFHDELGHALCYRHDYWLNSELATEIIANGQLDAAIDCWRRAIDLGWSCGYTEFQLGHALTAKGDFSAAIPYLRRACDLKVEDLAPAHVAEFGLSGEVKGPDFIIIGATKCGTTSLYEYMCEHPQVLPAVWKEIEYFRFPERGLDWYLSHFPRIPNADTRFVSGEASSCYMSLFDAKTAVATQFPDALLIALVRDPVDKAISHCHHDRKIGCETRSAEAALAEELDILEALDRPWHDAEEYWTTQRGYVWLAMYSYFLENWLTTFSRDRLLVIPSDDLYEQPAATLAQVYAFLDLPNHELSEYKVHLKGQYERKSDPIRDRLTRFFEPHNERLFELMGRRLNWQHPKR